MDSDHLEFKIILYFNYNTLHHTLEGTEFPLYHISVIWKLLFREDKPHSQTVFIFIIAQYNFSDSLLRIVSDYISNDLQEESFYLFQYRNFFYTRILIPALLKVSRNSTENDNILVNYKIS